MAQAEHPLSWSDLPPELAGLVLCRLPAYSDRVRFGAVCRHWSFSSKQHHLPPPLPCLMLSDGTMVSLPNDEYFQFHDCANYHSSCHEWLIFLRDGTCSVINPFSKITLTLPNLSCLSLIDEPLEIINGHVTLEGEIHQESLYMDADLSIKKVIVCSAHLVAAIVNIEPRLHTVALCQPGADSWLVSELGSKGHLLDMVFFKGKLYAIDKFMDLLVIDVAEDNDSGKLSISRIERLIESPSFAISVIQNGFSDIIHFLFESHGALLLLRRTFFGVHSGNDREGMSIEPAGTEFKVFEADFNSSQWVGVTSIGDYGLLFVGKSYSQSICVSQYMLKGDILKGSNILFVDDSTCNWFWNDMPGPFAVYDMSDGTTYSLELSELLVDGKAPATWLFPSVI